MYRQIIFVILILFLSLSTAIASSRTALVIGNGSYKSETLLNSVNDAEDIAGILKQLDFKVILKTNADKRTMLKAITQFGKEIHEAQVGLFFYAGHGVQVAGINYLIPIWAYITN